MIKDTDEVPKNADKGEIMNAGDTNKKRSAFLSGWVLLHRRKELSGTRREGLRSTSSYSAA